MFDRRSFLKSTLAGTGLVAAGLAAPRFLTRTAAAAPRLGARGAKDTLLVVVQLTGGNDGLGTVIPFKDPLYIRYRPTLKQPVDRILKLSDEIGLHPALTGLAALHDKQQLCVVQGVGYPNPSQSHFRSMDIWQAGSTADHLAEGWLGKAMNRLRSGPGGFHLAMANESAPLAFAGAPAKVPSLTSLADFQLRTLAGSGADRQAQRQIIENAAQPGAPSPLLDFVKQTAVNTYASARRLQEIAGNYEPKATYPASGLAERLKLAAQLIAAELDARIFYVSIDGFDTHANQAASHANLLSEVGDAVRAFYEDMAAQGHGERVLVMTFSEFGRRARENGSKGTDHGSAAPMFLVGSKVKAGLVGAHPSLEKLEDGNLAHHTDFRQVYAAILEHWLGVRPTDVLDGRFTPAEVLQA
ncbi:MAG TPA: DUF1501 domain-containing protein [Gemmatales bacterium]|nr:DUF1501 domain-containing protein [Gemmatales bacterium]HMP60844.1 DUF1501 domain-containing protein [Gemmatales bacterium]